MMLPMKAVALSSLLVLVLAPAGPRAPGDWPTWRHDAARTAASPHELPAALHLQWVREYPRLAPAWPDQPRMQFDAAYEPVVLGATMFVCSSRTDSVTALDTRTGEEKWRTFCDGPVRFAPAAWDGRIYVASDDGHLHCLDAEKGGLLWKFRGGPTDRRILGNERLISTWPARGAPVVADGQVYFAASIWPFMGTFIHALDARTGRVVWTNDGDGSLFIQQPHRADAFAGVAPQGPLAVLGESLLVAGGRSVPAIYDRRTGRLQNFKLVENSKKGGFDVAAAGGLFFCGGSGFDAASGLALGEVGRQLVLSGDVITWDGKDKGIHSFRTPRIETVETKDRKGNPVKKLQWAKSTIETIDLPRVECLIRAGSRLYAGTEGRVWAVDPAGKSARWSAPIEGTPLSLVAADDRLFVSTREGRLYCFGGDRVEPRIHPFRRTASAPPEEIEARAVTVLRGAGTREGWGVVWGAGRLAVELARLSALRIVVIDPDPGKVAALRRELVAADLHGGRVAVLEGDPRTFDLPPYLASVMAFDGVEPDGAIAARAFESLRPYGGAMCLAVPVERAREWARGLEGAQVAAVDGLAVLSRPGALAGAGSWTHEHADAANTRVSLDRRVKAPLGLLWFGGPSNEAILPRHGHGPQPQVLDGRLFIEGMDVIRAMDIYTGRVLWEAKLPGVGRFFNNTAHQPGANASGTNFISTPDGIYVVVGRACVRLDPATGRRTAEFRLPPAPGSAEPPVWGYLNVAGDYLVGGAEPLNELGPLLMAKDPKEGDDPDPATVDPLVLKALAALRGSNDNLSSSRRLVVMDRHTGAVLWTARARAGFRHNAVCAGGGRLYAIDRLSGPQVARMKRRGETPEVAPRLAAFDIRTGRELWSSEEEVFGTWLSYSEKRDVLLESGRKAGDTLNDEPKGMRARRGATGEVLWKEDLLGPPLIRGDDVLMVGKGCDLLTGKPKLREHPLTGEPVEWTWMRTYGCNTPAASEHLLTFRSGAAGYFDLAGDSGTGNFGGFRSSCTNNLVVAGGVLTAPDYTRTCTCSYQNQTSLALVPVPGAEMWTYFGSDEVKGRARRVGINLGAPGDRRAPDGTLWVEFPSVAGKSPKIPVVLRPEKPDLFRRHESRVNGGGLAWVAASGARGLESLSVTLAAGAKDEKTYTVRLHFAEPDGLGPGERVFGVWLQGRPALRDFDIAREAGGPDRALVREFRGVRVRDVLDVGFDAVRGQSLLCGVEVAPEGW